MRQAIAAVQSGRSVLSSAILHSVPMTTLGRRLQNRYPNPHGRQALFTRFGEETFVFLCKPFEQMKLPLTTSDVIATMKAERERKREQLTSV